MFANILVPLDGSALSEHALPMAQHVARASPTVMHLLQVLSLRPELETALLDSGEATVTVLELARDAAQRLRDAQTVHGQAYLAGLAGPLRQAGLQVTTALREGAAAEQIVAYAQAQAIDLIVMSTHGYSGFKRFLLGSVTDRVLRAGQTPVLVVPVVYAVFGLDLKLVAWEAKVERSSVGSTEGET